MKLQTLLYISLLFLAFQSCGVIKGPEMKFDTCSQNALFTSDYQPNITEKVRTNGYFFLYDQSSSKFLKGIGFRLFDSGVMSNISLYFNGIPEDSMSLDKIDEIVDVSAVFFIDSAYGDGPKGGIYKISGDTLIIDRYYSDSDYIFRDNWTIETSKYKVINNEILEEIPTGDNEKDKLRREFSGLRVYRFVPATKLPDEFISSVRDPKWMWKNEEDWRAYKKARDEYKKSLWQQTP